MTNTSMTNTSMTNTSVDAGINMRPFEASLPMALLRARETAMALFRPLLAENDLTEQQWRVLRALSAAREPIDAGELAEQTFLLAPSLSRILAAMDERDLIGRTADPSDHRRALITLSKSGARLVQSIAPHSEARYERIEDAFGADRLHALLHELHELAVLEVDPIDAGAS